MTKKVCILSGKNGRVLAARPVELAATGKDGPSGLRMVAHKNQTVAIVEIRDELTKMSPREFFRGHIVKDGRLVAKASRRK
jgi:hypothetical protein